MVNHSRSEKNRRGGVLLHPTALPVSPVCGSFGRSAREWLKVLASNGITVWQILPLAPPDGTGSPYSSPSSFALNPWLLDAEDLAEENFLASGVLGRLPGADLKAEATPVLDFQLADARASALASALAADWPQQSSARQQQFERWRVDQAHWLTDHVNFVVLRAQHNGLPWWSWPHPLAVQQPAALAQWRLQHGEALLEQELLQWHLDRQWQRLRVQARDLNIEILGDLPFYVARDSADVWSHRSLFSIAANGRLRLQSGVPPDYFSETGQLWGTPVYSWARHRRTGFRWWRNRLKRQWRLADRLRLDHFRALAAFWAVPGDDDTAQNGVWQRSPGFELLRLLRRDAGGKLPIVAEDLGVITPDVERLRDRFRLPGMKVLQFAFDGNPRNPYLPSNIKGSRWVVYTGTHDNPTTLGWWQRLDESSKRQVGELLGCHVEAPGWQLMELGMATSAALVVSPLQDLLHLDDQARFNTPGTIGGNWCWRMSAFDEALQGALKGYGERAAAWGR